jgi:uncharacterized protein (UPF0335 family)
MSDDARLNSPNGPHLRAFVDRIERLSEEKAALSGDIERVFDEAKFSGFDVKVLRKLVALRRVDEHKRQEENEILSVYLTALGMEPL